MKFRWRRLFIALAAILVVFFLPVGSMLAVYYYDDNAGYRGFSRHSTTDQAPDASSDEAVIQVYAARAARWQGAIGVHTWIATKRHDENHYTRLEVIGYRVRWGGDAVRIRPGTPDAMWFGQYPTLLREIRGDQSLDALIDRLHSAAQNYPYADSYTIWPGPNSNTFTAHIARQIPELRLELPSNAIGKDYLPDNGIIARTPSGTGLQVSARGYVGALVALEEGIEFNFLGLTAGIDLYPPALKLPGVGRVGFSDKKSFDYYSSDLQLH